jgi:hypothetical protein
MFGSLGFVKAVHTAIFVFFGACIAVVAFSAVSGVIGWATWTAFVLVEVAVIVFVATGFPFTDDAERPGAANGAASDLLLPVWFAQRLPMIAGIIFGLAALGLMLRALG